MPLKGRDLHVNDSTTWWCLKKRVVNLESVDVVRRLFLSTLFLSAIRPDKRTAQTRPHLHPGLSA